MDHNNRSILIIYTGGTIGMLKDPVKGSLKPLDFNKIKKHIPEIEEFGYHIEAISFDPPIDSSDIDISTWTRIADIIGIGNLDCQIFLPISTPFAPSLMASWAILSASSSVRNLGPPAITTGMGQDAVILPKSSQ